MRKIVPLFVIVIIALALGIGCGDETTIINYTTDSLWDTTYTSINGKWAVNGQIYLDPHLHAEGIIHSDENIPVKPDSIKIGGSQVPFWQQSGWLFGRFSYEFKYDNKSDTRFSPGDTVTLELFLGDDVGVCNVVVMNNKYLTNLAVPIPDTIPFMDSLRVTWNVVPFKEWYNFRVWGRRDSSGQTVYFNYDTLTMDTTALIPPVLIQSNAELHIVPLGYTGPKPGDSAGNLNGNLIRGTILSHNGVFWLNDQSGYFITVGNGMPSPPSPADHKNSLKIERGER